MVHVTILLVIISHYHNNVKSILDFGVSTAISNPVDISAGGASSNLDFCDARLNHFWKNRREKTIFSLLIRIS